MNAWIPAASADSDPSAVHVTLHVWRVPTVRIPRTLPRMASDRTRLRRQPGVQFAKLLGTAKDRRFGPTRADLTRWAAVVVWDHKLAADGFDETRVAQAWRALSRAYCRIDLSPLSSRGSWAGRKPFAAAGPGPTEGPVLALTRARLRPTQVAVFWHAIAPVAAAVDTAPGLLATFGIGEAPLGWQGTVSLWQTARDLVEFTRHPQHRKAIERTRTQRWYAEELFARFAVLDIAGDPEVIGWTKERTVSR